MHKISEKYKLYFQNKKFLVSLGAAVLLFAASLIINFYAGMYAAKSESNAITDIVLSNTRVFDVDFIFVQGIFIFVAFLAFLCLIKPKRLPFVIKSIALFVFVRSIFITLTHLGQFPSALPIDSKFLHHFSFGADLFFSGHTGLPFLMALIFWDDLYLRILFIISAIIFAVVVLLGHLHYSIDVLSAFFITYGIYNIALKFFLKDHKLFMRGLEHRE